MHVFPVDTHPHLYSMHVVCHSCITLYMHAFDLENVMVHMQSEKSRAGSRIHCAYFDSSLVHLLHNLENKCNCSLQ